MAHYASGSFPTSSSSALGAPQHGFSTAHDTGLSSLYISENGKQHPTDISHDLYCNSVEDLSRPPLPLKVEIEEEKPSRLSKKPTKNHQICKICNKTLASAASYYVHLKQHSDFKPFNCTWCEATFSRKPYLEVHKRVHTGEKPYQCPLCQKRFTQKSSLNTHKKSHSDLKPYTCQMCFKSFAVKSYLTAHRWTHVAEAGVMCNDCNLTFNNKSAYFSHRERHHRKLHECGACARAFAKESYLIRHMCKAHGQSG